MCLEKIRNLNQNIRIYEITDQEFTKYGRKLSYNSKEILNYCENIIQYQIKSILSNRLFRFT